jgi:hypothetical protein
MDTIDVPFMDLESSVRELRSLVNKNSPGIVFVAVYDETGALRSSGSGFYIDNEGRIITNASIWEDAYSAEVLSDLNSYREVELLNRNEELDIALIKVKAINETPLELDFNYETNLGERVIIIGKSDGQVKTVSEGLISSFPKTEENLKFVEIQTAVSILPYQSSKDGPVLNTVGKVVGVVSNAISRGTWRGFNNEQMNVVSLWSIKSMLSDSAHTEHLHTAKSKVWFKWFMSFLKSNFIKGFIFLYDIGSTKIIIFLSGVILIIYIIERLYNKYKKIRYGK